MKVFDTYEHFYSAIPPTIPPKLFAGRDISHDARLIGQIGRGLGAGTGRDDTDRYHAHTATLERAHQIGSSTEDLRSVGRGMLYRDDRALAPASGTLALGAPPGM